MAGTCGYGEGLSGSTNAGNFLTSCKVYWLASQEGLCSMEQVSIVSKKNTPMPNFMNILSVGAELFFADGRTYRRTDMTNLTLAFRNFLHAPNEV